MSTRIKATPKLATHSPVILNFFIGVEWRETGMMEEWEDLKCSESCPPYEEDALNTSTQLFPIWDIRHVSGLRFIGAQPCQILHLYTANLQQQTQSLPGLCPETMFIWLNETVVGVESTGLQSPLKLRELWLRVRETESDNEIWCPWIFYWYVLYPHFCWFEIVGYINKTDWTRLEATRHDASPTFVCMAVSATLE